MDESFYITLSSNVNSQFYPDNKLTHFFNKLHSPLNLHEKRWMVGLAEIQCPFNWKNIQKDDASCTFYDVNSLTTKTIYIPEGHYKEAKHLVFLINAEIKKFDEKQFHKSAFFEIDKISQKTFIQARPNILIMFSDKLSRILGFNSKNPQKVNNKHYYGDEVVDIRDGVHHLYLYTNIIEHRPVGDTSLPLLRIVPVVDTGSNLYKINTFENIHYLPARRQIFQDVEIDIRNGVGEYIPFERGSILVTLHCKPA